VRKLARPAVYLYPGSVVGSSSDSSEVPGERPSLLARFWRRLGQELSALVKAILEWG
jgi:hypothetical protein